MNVVRPLRSKSHVRCHAEDIVEFARRLRIDREDTVGRFDIHGDEGGFAAADYYNGGGRSEGGWRDGSREGADVFLAGLREVLVTSRGGEAREMYAAEEMSDEDDEDPLCGVGVDVEALEWTGGAVSGEDGEFGSVADVFSTGPVLGSGEREVPGGIVG